MGARGGTLVSDEPRRKLIEVALPLEAINRESAREKSIRHGHPSTLHLWWARRPLAACRAVLFASIVDDPASRPDLFPTEAEQERERGRLFQLIEQLVRWESTNDERILAQVREEISRYTDNQPPPVLDPFCGGGSIPLEAQRLGLEAHASDLNPVAVLITKALIEIPPRFKDMPPVNPEARERLDAGGWRRAQGLAEDVRYYGRWMREEAEQRIGHLYPSVGLPDTLGGGQATTIAWLWARTVRCPNPACGAEMPLVRSLDLATKTRRRAWLAPIIDKAAKIVTFEVNTGPGQPPAGTVNRRGAVCLVCETPVPFEHVRAEGRANRLGTQLLAMVADGTKGRIYVSPDPAQTEIARSAEPDGVPDTDLPTQALGLRVQAYGITKHRQLFTNRQLVALTTFADLASQVRDRVLPDAARAGFPDDGVPLSEGGSGAGAYADAVATYLAMAVSRLANRGSVQCLWNTGSELIEQTFARQAMSMNWNFAEANPFSDSTGSWSGSLEWVPAVIETLPASGTAIVSQRDAASIAPTERALIATDPPYYDNIGYAALSDFFYVWLRRALGARYALLMSTLLTPKDQELIAEPGRHPGGLREAQRWFESGLAQAFLRMRAAHRGEFPLTLYYGFKQSEDSDGDGARASTGWQTMLEGLLGAGFAVTGTWPVRTERSGGVRHLARGALASSIVLVCRPRPETAALATRKEFVAALRAELPEALRRLQSGSIAPVDLAQAAIGPGMAVFSRYSKVVEADGKPMRVRAALALINEALDELLVEQEADFDADTRWCGAWFEQYGMDPGPFGVAETLSRAKNTAINGLVNAGVLHSRAGEVRLLDRNELQETWDPTTDTRLTVWEVTQHLIARHQNGGEEAAAELRRQVGGGLAEGARELAYRLFAICERKGWAQEALAYNALVSAWPEITRLAARTTDVTVPGEQEAMEV